MSESHRRPKILVTLDTGEALRRGVALPTMQTKAAYGDSVITAGGTPLFVGPTGDDRTLADLISWMDGVVVTGGEFDIDPALFGGIQSADRLDPVKPVRTRFEWRILEGALSRGIPVLGVCGGMQLLNVVRGGTLIQDIRSRDPSALDHEQPGSPTAPDHPVTVLPGTQFRALVGSETLSVNSTHHQAVDRLGRGLHVLARAPDGIVEAIGGDDLSVLGVQWHPELLDDAVARAIYGNLVACCCSATEV